MHLRCDRCRSFDKVNIFYFKSILFKSSQNTVGYFNAARLTSKSSEDKEKRKDI